MRPIIAADRFDAVIFDMDGVITDTASVHEAVWKDVFDEFLARRADGGGFSEFTPADYRRYVDGKTRYDGVASFLESRGIELPWGEPDDPPGEETICAIGNRKNERFRRHIFEHGVEPYLTTVAVMDALDAAGITLAIISGSRNAEDVLSRAGLLERFAAKVDGTDAGKLGLPGKPDPAVFLEAARRVGATPERAVVVEDAISGVEAGKNGGFGLVIGVDRSGHPDDLAAAGADIVVSDLEEVSVETANETTPIDRLPAAAAREDEIVRRVAERDVAIFLDYDGTLTPIVEDPTAATITDATRDVIRGLADVCTVAIVSGRDLDDVRNMVAVDGIHYAGSHGFDILAPDGTRRAHGEEFLPALDAAESALVDALADIDGARIERKRFAIAVHFRQVAGEDVPAVEQAVERIAGNQADLRVTGGKKILELRPDIPWDKGRALLSLLETLGLDHPDVVPLYIGDDVTDEDGFRALQERGLGLVVRGEDDERRTLADYAFDHPDEVVAFLDDLRERLEADA